MATSLTRETGDLWHWHLRGSWVVIPTNLDYTHDGRARMGAGLALEAARRFPQLPWHYGGMLRMQSPHGQRGTVEVFPALRLVCLATKYAPRDAQSSLDLIYRGLVSLKGSMERNDAMSEAQIVLPPLGCGLGKLPWAQVEPLIGQAGLDLSRVRVVAPPGFWESDGG